MTIGLGGIIMLALVVSVVVIASKVKAHTEKIQELEEELKNK